MQTGRLVTLWRGFPALGALAAVAVTACGDSGTNLGGDDDQDVAADADAGAEDVGGSDDGAVLEDTAIRDDAGWPEGTGGCECVNPLDECVADTCVRTGYVCNALNACEPGYECGPDSRCHCVDSNVCGIRCDRTGYCPEDPRHGTVCAPDGVCRPVLPCIADAMCFPGDLCAGGGVGQATCVPPGTGGVGSVCTSNTDCAEGVCETAVCLQRCRRNSDCAPGLLCGSTREGQLGCMVETECTGCSGASQYCFGIVRCRDSNCVTGADCPGNCYLDLNSPVVNAGQCMSDPMALPCADDEFASMMALEQCFVHRACWSAEDCGAGYECVPHIMVEGAGFCGRTP